MAQSRPAGRPVAIILPLIVAVFLLALSTTASAQTIDLGFGGDGIFPKFATTNSMYWVRVVYNDQRNTDTPPIVMFRFEGRPRNNFSPSVINLLPFLQQAGTGYETGILPSPTASTLTGAAGSFTTTGVRSLMNLMVASTVDQVTDYTSSDILITSGPNTGHQSRVSGFDNFSGVRVRTSTADAQGFGPLATTGNGDPNGTTLISDPLPPGDWSDGRVRIIGPPGHALVNEVRAISTYDTGTNTITVATAFPVQVTAGLELRLEGPYTTTAAGTTRILLSTSLPGVDGQWVGGSVRMTGPTGDPLIGETQEISTYDVTSGQIVVTGAFTQAVGSGVEFELDGFTVIESGLGRPRSGETWLGARIKITQDPHLALDEERNVVAWSRDTGTFRVDRPFPAQIVSGDAFEIFLAIFTLAVSPPVPPVGPGETFSVLGGSLMLMVPNWYLNGIDFAASGIIAQGKIVVDLEDDANRDGDVLDAGDNLPGFGNRSDFYLFASTDGSPPNVRYSLGPFTVAHGLISGEESGGVYHPGAARSHQFRFRARFGSGSPPTTIETPTVPVLVCGSAYTNRDALWWQGSINTVDPDPVSILDQPPWLVNIPSDANSGPNTADDATSSSIYTFQCIYRHPDGLPPRFNYDIYSAHSNVPSFQGTVEDSFRNRSWSHPIPGRLRRENWIYFDDDDTWLHMLSITESGVALIIDNDFSHPHFMAPIDASGNELNISNLTRQDFRTGVRYVYQILPTGYDPEIDGRIDAIIYRLITGRPLYNAMTNFRPADVRNLVTPVGAGHLSPGLHSYQFVCTDDFFPPGRKADVVTGRPGAGSFNREYTAPVRDFSGEIVTPPAEDPADVRWNGYAFAYPIASVDESNPPTLAVRDNDPVLYAPQDNPRSWQLPPIGVLEYPTNDGTIAPNFFSDFPDMTARADNRWLQNDTYTFLINYASSSNTAPLQMEMLLRREGAIAPDDVTTDPATTSAVIPMQQVDPNDSDYRDGALFFCELSPLNLPDPPGPASNAQVDDYQYFFRASDGTRTAWFPRRPEGVDPVLGRTFPEDPLDFGVRSRDLNNDYYFFRVNTPPVLANGEVTPSSQRPGLPFMYTVDYSDIDGPFRVHFTGSGGSIGQQGDAPFRANLSVDTFGDGDGELRVVSIAGAVIEYERVDGQPVTYTGDGLVNDADGDGVDDAAGTPPGNAVVDELFRRPPSVPTVNWRGREMKFESGGAAGQDPILIATNDSSGAPPTITLASAPSGVAPGDTFSIVDWATTSMFPADPSDVDFTAAKQYRFDTGTVVELTPGRLHEYFFEFADDHADWLFPDDPSIRREGEIIRIPEAGGFGSPDNLTGPEVLVNRAPTLTNFAFTPDPTPTGPGNDARVGSGTPDDNADGNTATPFTLQVTYTDLDNDPPTEILLGLDGTPAAPDRVLALTEQDSNDTLFSDGKLYEAQVRLEVDAAGHILRGRAADGVGGVFPIGAPSGQFSDPAAPNGPIVVPNSSPRLFFPAVDEPDGVAPSLNPAFPGLASGLSWTPGGFPPADHEFVAGKGRLGTATADGDPAGTTLVDGTIGGADDEWVDAQLRMTSGLSRGQQQRVMAYEAATGTLTLERAFSTQIVAGTTYELALRQRSPGLDPDSATSSDTYTYRIIYFDADTFSPEQRGNPPEFVRLIIDSGQNQPGGFTAMTPVDPNDTDYTNGAEFSVDVPGGSPILSAGSPHEFFFEARDGLDTARTPDAPSAVRGPIVDDEPAPPTNLSVLDVEPDQGGQISLQWRRSADDGAGRGDVIRYSVRRAIAGSGAPIDDPIAGAPFEIVSIIADARDPYTFLDTDFGAVPRVQGTTTAAGTTTTVIDNGLGGVDDQWNGGVVTLLVAPFEVRPVVDYEAATGTLTVFPAFSNAIGAGANYVVAVLDRLGQNPDDGRDVVATDYEHVVLAFDDVSDGSNSLSAASNTDSAVPADNLAPTPPATQTSTARSDGSIQVDWSLSVDDPTFALPTDPWLPPQPAGDLIGYRVYRDEITPVNPDATPPSPTLVELANETGTGTIPPSLGGQLGPGATSLIDSTAVLGTTYYYLVRVVDRTQVSTNVGGTNGSETQDTEAPFFDSFDPADGSPAAPINTDITFQVHDLGVGVDMDTISMTLDVGGTVEGPFDNTVLQITQLVPGEDTDLEVVFDRSSSLPTNTPVTVNMSAADKLDNGPATGSFSFTTETARTIEGTIKLTTDGTTALPLALDVTINVIGPDGPLPSIPVTSDAGGDPVPYVIDNVVSGDYEITPVLSGTTWEPPPPFTVTVPPSAPPGAVAGPDFVGTVTTFTLSGVIADQVGNAASGVTITVDTTDGTPGLSVLTQTDGSFSIELVLAGTYTLTPSLPLTGFSFSPTERTVIAGQDPTDNLDFSILFSISGTVTRSDTEEGLEGVVMSANGQQATTDANGEYTIVDLPAGDISVVATHADFTFTLVDPDNETVTVNLNTVETGNLPGIDFLASPTVYSISGTVSAAVAGGLAGLEITVAATGGPSTPPAVAVDLATGAYTITGLEAGTYTVTPSEATGAAQFVSESDTDKDDEVVTVGPNQTGINFTAFRVFQVIAPASELQLLTAPFTAMTPAITAADVFGTESVASWDPLGMPGGYVLFSVDPNNPALRVEPGRGFFARILTDPLPLVPGTPAPTDRPFSIPIFSEWTMVGNPFLAAFAWSNVQQSSPEVSDLAWVYVNDGTNGGYVLVTDMQAFNTLTRIEPYQGFWQRVTVGTVGASITIPEPSPSPSGVLSRPADADSAAPEHSAKPRSLVDGGWLIQVVAATVKTRDACNYVGVGAPARGVVSTLKIDNPPAAAGSADIYFDGAAQGEPGRRLAAHIRAADAAEVAFDFVVATDLVNEDVTVSLPNLAQLSKYRQVLLIDLDADETVFARTKSAYTYNSGDGGERHFRIEVREAVQAGLRVVGLQGVPTRGARGAGAEIRYSLTAPAAVTTQIYNVSGRLVARVESATSRGAGSAAALWNGRSLAGTQVPSGVYSVRVSATGEQGIKADAITIILIRR